VGELVPTQGERIAAQLAGAQRCGSKKWLGMIADGARMGKARLVAGQRFAHGAGTRVKVIAERPEQVQMSERKPTLRELLKHAGTVADLPGDMAEQHDHYVRATPRR